jgi:hypothetical protein
MNIWPLKVVVSFFLVGVMVWFLISHQQRIRAGVATRDSIQYWATGKRLIHRQNPYSVEDVQTLERGEGYPANRPLMFRCPPWALWMTILPGLFSSYWAWVVWLAVLLSCLVTAMRMCWTIYGDQGRPSAVFVATAYLFAPVAACLVAGQLGLLLLLGIALFLRFESNRPFLAGAALILPMAKPHILALLWPMLVLWAVSRREWSLLVGAGSTFLLALGVAFAFDPSVFAQYRAMLQQQAIQNEFIPALSGMIRVLFFRRFFWVQFVPLGLGFAWSAWYYLANRQSWDWRVDGPAVLVLSLLTTPYAWMTDEVVLLPAILQAVLWLQREKLKLRSRLVVLTFVLLNFLLLLIVQAQVPPPTGIYFWSSLVWFGWYWYARSFRRSGEEVGSPRGTSSKGSNRSLSPARPAHATRM